MTCRFVHAKQRDLPQNDKSIWVPALICVFFQCKTAILGPDLQVCIGPRPHLRLLHANQRLFDQNCMSLWAPELTCDFQHAIICGFCMQNSDFWIRIANLFGSQISPVALFLQCSVISTRTTCLYASQPLSVVFACKTATFGAELKVCMEPRPHLSFCACKSA